VDFIEPTFRAKLSRLDLLDFAGSKQLHHYSNHFAYLAQVLIAINSAGPSTPIALPEAKPIISQEPTELQRLPR